MVIDASYNEIASGKTARKGNPLRASLGLAVVALLLFGLAYSLVGTRCHLPMAKVA